MSDRHLIIRTLPRPGWTTVDWTSAEDTDYPPAGQLTGEIELADSGDLFMRFRNDNDDPFILVLDKQGLRIYESENLPPNTNDTVAFDAEKYVPGDQALVYVLHIEHEHGSNNIHVCADSSAAELLVIEFVDTFWEQTIDSDTEKPEDPMQRVEAYFAATVEQGAPESYTITPQAIEGRG